MNKNKTLLIIAFLVVILGLIHVSNQNSHPSLVESVSFTYPLDEGIIKGKNATDVSLNITQFVWDRNTNNITILK